MQKDNENVKMETEEAEVENYVKDGEVRNAGNEWKRVQERQWRMDERMAIGGWSAEPRGFEQFILYGKKEVRQMRRFKEER